jgi:hypothetical protein
VSSCLNFSIEVTVVAVLGWFLVFWGDTDSPRVLP